MGFFPYSKPNDEDSLLSMSSQSGKPEFLVEGRRLGTLGMAWLKIECGCAHKGKVAVTALAARHGSETRVSDAIESLRCSQCGQTRIRKVSLLTL